jgi:hypothetical protein
MGTHETLDFIGLFPLFPLFPLENGLLEKNDRY